MNGLIVDKGEHSYSHFAKIFINIPILVESYNWLITDAECNPQNSAVGTYSGQYYLKERGFTNEYRIKNII